MSELLPCPFCGSTKSGIAASQEMADGKYIEEGREWSVLCDGCGASCSAYCDSEEEAVTMWNMRFAVSDEQIAMSGINKEWNAAIEALGEIANRASNLADDDAAEWMPSIYSIACKAIGEDPEPLLKATGFDGEPETWPTRAALPAKPAERKPNDPTWPGPNGDGEPAYSRSSTHQPSGGPSVLLHNWGRE